jgi:hypothetical protein
MHNGGEMGVIILRGAIAIFISIQLIIITALVGAIHVLFVTGLFIYQDNESSYKVLAYAVLMDLELIAALATLSFVVKTRTGTQPPKPQCSLENRSLSISNPASRDFSRPLLESELPVTSREESGSSADCSH